MVRRKERTVFLGFFLLALAIVAAACDESFDPIAPSELAFSVYGYLDASADTQWIRVMPIRPLRVTSQDPLGATVTLEHLGTGRIIELEDSLFTFSSHSDPDLGSEGTYLHNFWTLEDIEPGAAYRFLGRRDGKQPAEAVVQVPRDYGVEVAISQQTETALLRITGLKHLPFLTTAAYFYDDCGPGLATAHFEGRSADDETHEITIHRPEVIPRNACGIPLVQRWEIWIVGSGAAWPAGQEYSPATLGRSGWTSNITNALGFLGGVLTKVIPFEDCQYPDDGEPVPDTCRLRYDGETATVTGTVSETRCGDGPIDSVTVQLTEMDRDPARIRSALSNRAGEFLIGALEPGIPHFLWARAPQVPVDSMFDVRTFTYVYTEWDDVHTLATDTLTFMPGEQVEYDIHLERLTPCSQPPPATQ